MVQPPIAPVTRFAPSPTGRLHLGNVRTALVNFLVARASGGRFLVRSEDTDRERSEDHFLRQLLADLRWLGIDWDAGPDCPPGGESYCQSERSELYAKYYSMLSSSGRSYRCFCRPEVLRLSRKQQLAAGRPPRYAGTCAGLSPADAEAREAGGEPASLRFRVDPAGPPVVFADGVRGEQSTAQDTIGDFVIRRSDGTPAFFFSNAVDDALMGVTLVIRGEDHLTNTPRQLLLLEALGLPAPGYAHMSLLVGNDGAPLSKRHGSASLADLMEEGYLPLAIANHLARLGHAYEDTPFADMARLASDFRIARMGRAPARHDPAQLDHWQREAVTGLSDDAFGEWISAGDAGATLRGLVEEARFAAFVGTVRHNVLRPRDALAWAERLCRPPEGDPTGWLAKGGSELFAKAAELAAAGNLDFKPFSSELAEATGLKGARLFKPLRAALTGCDHGPQMHDLFAFLGASELRLRFKAAADKVA